MTQTEVTRADNDAAETTAVEPLWPMVAASLALLVGVAALLIIIAGSTGDALTLVVAAAVFLGPGLAAASFTRSTALDGMAWVLPIGLSIACLGTRVLLWLGAYRPTPIAVLLCAGTVAASGVSLRRHINRGTRQASVSAARGIAAGHVRALKAMPHFRVWFGATAVALVCWVIAMVATNPADLTTWGLLGALSPVWYIGLAAVVVALGVAFSQSRQTWAVPLAIGAALVFTYLHASGSVLFDVPRFAWTYKHIGLADYMATFKDNPRATIDIYQAWPSFFSASGIVSGATSINGLVALARWWPLLIQFSSVLLLRRLIAGLFANRAIVWTAVVLMLVGNWIGQDYFSPQSVAFILGLGVSCLVVTHLAPADGDITGRDRFFALRVAPRRIEWKWVVAVLVLYAAIVVTHQLTPYLLLPGLVLAVPFFGIRPTWLPLALIALVGGYTLLNLNIVRRQNIGDNIGSIVDNIQTRGTTGQTASRIPEFGIYFASGIALSAVIAVAAVLGVLATKRLVGMRFLGLAAFAVGPVVILTVEAYGQEGTLRAYLMCLPWLVISAAVWLNTVRAAQWSRIAVAVVSVAGLGAACLVYFVRDLDFRIHRTDIDVTRWYELHAPAQSIVVNAGPEALPKNATAYYFNHSYAALHPVFPQSGASLDVPATIRNIEPSVKGKVKARGNVYLAFGPTISDSTRFEGLMTASDAAKFRDGIAADPAWQRVFTSGSSSLYQLVKP